jgi:hypothetical protein
MQQNDIIMVNVVGTNGTTRHQKTIAEKFNGAGNILNQDGQIDGTRKDVLRNLPNGATVSKAPDFPTSQFLAAQAKGAAGIEEIKAIQIAYAEQFAAWEKSNGGGNENLQVAKAVLDYAKEFHGFQETDGDHFVMKLENLDVVTTTLNDGRTLFTVGGTAVFGAAA